jgi:glycosyltransferase involved in cell wall biosynthesis
MKTAARFLGLGRQTHFLGVRRDIVRLMAASDAAILPSEREGLPRSIMECMAFGIPVLGSNVRGTSELLSGGCGLLFPVGDTQAIATALSQIQASPDLSKSCVENASVKIRRYSLDRVLALHEQIYSCLLQQIGSSVRE